MPDHPDSTPTRPTDDDDGRPTAADETIRVWDETVDISDATVVGGAMPSGPTETGTSIGRYRLIRELGEGGQGQVFLAEDRELHRQVAFKILGRAASASEMARLRFRREAEIASRLNHPHICTIYEFGEVEGLPFMAMEYVEGESLSERIKRVAADPSASRTGLRLGPSRDSDAARAASRSRSGGSLGVARFIETVARALHAAHEAGLVHRDIKSGNIMIDREGQPVILDFGLARGTDSDTHTLTRSGDILGTPAYMAPEQITQGGRHADHRSDVFALGVVLYECLTLRRPFDGHSLEALYQAIVGKEPLAPRRIDPSVPRDLEIVVQTALDKDRSRRYQSAFDLAEDLRRVREHEPILARPAGLVLRLRRWAQRKPAIAALLVVMAIAIPTIAALTTRHFAMLPQVRLQEAAERRQKVENELTTAIALIAPGDTEGGARHLEAALRLDPDSVEALGMLVYARMQKDPPEALKILEAHRELAQRHSSLGALRARVLRRLGRDEEASRIKVDAPANHVDWYLQGCAALDAGAAGEAGGYADALTAFFNAAVTSPVRRTAYYFQIAFAIHGLGGAADPELSALAIEALTNDRPEDPEAWYFAGVIARTMDLERSIELNRRALAIRPDPRYFQNLGAALQSLERHEEAVEARRACVATYPDSAIDHYFLHAALDAAGQAAEAVAALRRAIELDPARTDWRIRLGRMLLYRLGDAPAAVATLEEAARQAPGDPLPPFELGRLQEELRQPEPAALAYRAAIAIDPDHWRAHANLADILLRGGNDRREEALSLLLEAVRLAPSSSKERAIPLATLGRVLWQQGDLDSARIRFREAIDCDPGYLYPRMLLGDSFLNARDFAAAAAIYEEVTRVDPTYPTAHRRLGQALASLDRKPEAESSYREARRLQPENTSTLFLLADLLFDEGECEETATLLEEVLRLDANDAAARNLLGSTRRRLGDLPGAEACFRELLRRMPGEAVFHRNLGLTLEEAGDLDGAVESFHRAQELSPGHADGARFLSRAAVARARELREANDPQAAIALVDRVRILLPDDAALREERARLEPR
ncbi:MAG: tetratricopeptide repeat protein [Planctomycetota bacterium]